MTASSSIPTSTEKTAPGRFGQQALQTVRPGAVIFADDTPFTVLRYLQLVDKLRPDVLVRAPADEWGTIHPRWMFR